MRRLKESVSFLQRFVANPGRIGAVAPSSRQLARALTRPLANRSGPAAVLEVGAGTGAVTRWIMPLLRHGDRLDVIEADPVLAAYVRETYLEADRPEPSGQWRMFDQPLQNVKGLLQYDFIISGLPLNAFTIRDVRSILDTVKRHAGPACVFSYFEYIGIRPFMAAVRTGPRGRRFRLLSAYLDREIDLHQIRRQSVLLNVPPAYARHLWLGDPPSERTTAEAGRGQSLPTPHRDGRAIGQGGSWTTISESRC